MYVWILVSFDVSSNNNILLIKIDFTEKKCNYNFFYLVNRWHKWTAYSADAEDITESERCAPSILITFINMVLFKDNEYEPVCETAYMFAGMYLHK